MTRATASKYASCSPSSRCGCICCYRYEETIRYYADGRFELLFVSHGPGCESVIYRDSGESIWTGRPENDGSGFSKTPSGLKIEEFETYPVVDDLSPATNWRPLTGDVHYRWSLERTDPGLDREHIYFCCSGARWG